MNSASSRGKSSSICSLRFVRLVRYFSAGRLSALGGWGSDCRKAKISASSAFDVTLMVKGGIWPVGWRTYVLNAENEMGFGPRRGPPTEVPSA